MLPEWASDLVFWSRRRDLGPRNPCGFSTFAGWCTRQNYATALAVRPQSTRHAVPWPSRRESAHRLSPLNWGGRCSVLGILIRCTGKGGLVECNRCRERTAPKTPQVNQTTRGPRRVPLDHRCGNDRFRIRRNPDRCARDRRPGNRSCVPLVQPPPSAPTLGRLARPRCQLGANQRFNSTVTPV